MKRHLHLAGIALAITALTGFAGCESHNDLADAGEHHDHDGHDHDHDGHDHGKHGDHDHGHAHGAHGPNGGRLIELGRSHEYHAELLTDADGQTVRVHILNHDMQPEAVDSKNVQLNLVANDVPQSFAFQATSAGDLAAEYALVSAELWKLLEDESFSYARLNVFAGGSMLVGNVDHHDHAHAGGLQRR